MKGRRFFLKSWVAPIVVGVTLPKHAQASGDIDPVNRKIEMSVSNLLCDASISPGVASFTLCNNETEAVIVERLSSTDQPGYSSVQPSPPFTVPVNGCVNMELISNGTINCGVGVFFEAHTESFSAVGGIIVSYK